MTERESAKINSNAKTYNEMLKCSDCSFFGVVGHNSFTIPECREFCKQWLKDNPEPPELLEYDANKLFEGISKALGQKKDKNKLVWSLLPFEALEEVVKVLMFGAEKYSPDNWKHVTPKERYIDAAFRHLTAYAKGEKKDEETGLSHLAHAVCCLLFVVWFDKEEEKGK